MTTYGPWETQAPISREQRSLEEWPTAINRADFGPNDTNWFSPDVPLENRRMAQQGASDAVLSATPTRYLQASFADFTVWQSFFEGSDAFNSPPVHYQYKSGATRAYSKIRPDLTLPWVGSLPAGAIGYEWERDEAGEYVWIVEGATVDYAIYSYTQGAYGGSAEATAAFRITADAAALTDMELPPPDSVFSVVSTARVSAPVLDTGSLFLSADQLAAAQGALGFMVKLDQVSVTSPLDYHGYGDAVNISGWVYPTGNIGGNQAYIRVTYSLRPPRLRWLYDAPAPPPVLPPLRQSPRDDNLGTASATRVWPPSSSRQGGLRRLGGIDC